MEQFWAWAQFFLWLEAITFPTFVSTLICANRSRGKVLIYTVASVASALVFMAFWVTHGLAWL